MLFSWIRRRRRRKLLQTPFPVEWNRILKKNVRHWYWLEPPERNRWKDLIRFFIDEHNWEGCGGLTLTDEMKITIAGQACLLAIGLDDDNPFRNITSILVYPDAYVVPAERNISPLQRQSGPLSAAPSTMLGQAHINQAAGRGPVILSWKHTLLGGRDPLDGHNLVIHEFAHKLDMLDAVADGFAPTAVRSPRRKPGGFDVDGSNSLPNGNDNTPPGIIMQEEFDALKQSLAWGTPTPLRPYAATNPAEFFACSSEVFFERPLDLRESRPNLYAVLAEMYNQDIAARHERISR
jgi:MtfA peptidase